MPDFSRLTAATTKYKKHNRLPKQQELEHYASLSSLEEAILWAANAKDERGKRHPHQRRLKKESLKRSQQELMAAKDAIAQCTTFADLLHLVEQISRPINGIGELYCYDTALRLGAYLNLYPDQVYLHAGTRKGAKVLGFDPTARSLSPAQFPAICQELKPYEIEDLLCIYKHLLLGKGSIKT